MALTTTSTLSSVMQIYYDKRLLKRAEKELVYKQLGRVGTIPNLFIGLVTPTCLHKVLL